MYRTIKLALLFDIASVALAAPFEQRQSAGYYLSPQSAPNSCLSVSGAVGNNAAVTLSACTSSSTKWNIASGNNVGLSVSGTNYCLDSTTQFPANYQGLKVYQCYSGLAQQTFYYTNDLHIAVTGGNACLDSGNGGEYWSCVGGNNNQIWSASTSLPGGGSSPPITTTTTSPVTTTAQTSTTAPPVSVTTPTVVSNCVNLGQVAMTFDDGPYIYESTVSANLGNNKGTFFLNGNNYACIYDHVDEIRALHAAGHTLGSHTWSHPDLTTLSAADINTQLELVETAFIRILGLKPLYFRPPYGSYNAQVLSVLGQRGYKKVFLWSDDTQDADGQTLQYSEGVYDRITNSYPAAHMVLDHSTLQSTAQQLVPYAVNELTRKGYQLVAVDTCLGSQGEYPYVYVGQPGTRDSTWHC